MMQGRVKMIPKLDGFGALPGAGRDDPEAQVQCSRVAVKIGEIPIQLPLLPLALPVADQLLVVPLYTL